MGKKLFSNGFAVVFLLLIVFCSLPAIAEEQTAKQVLSEKSFSGTIASLTPCTADEKKAASPEQPKGDSSDSANADGQTKAQPVACDSVTESEIKTSVKGYTIHLRNLSGRYDINLSPCFAVNAGNRTILPEALRVGDMITVNYFQAGEKTTVNSVTLDKARASRKVKGWSMAGGIVITLVLLMLLNGILKKKDGISGLIIGYDKRYSNSKFQVTLWTFIVLFSYITLFLERFLANVWLSNGGMDFSLSISIHESLGILMGVSTGSFLGAKAITSSKVSSGSITKTFADKPSLSDLICNDYNAVDVGDAQMFAWTLVAAAVYVLNFIRMWLFLDPSQEVFLPDVDSTLLVLTGVSQGVYNAKKLLTSDANPKIASIVPVDKAAIGEKISINGTGFGNKVGAVIIDKNINVTIAAWYDEIIIAVVPADAPTGKTVVCVQTDFKQIVTSPYEISPMAANQSPVAKPNPEPGPNPAPAPVPAADPAAGR